MGCKPAILGLLLSFGLLAGVCFGKYSGGTGEPNDPYLIATPNDLNSIGLDPCDWDKHFRMIADINLAGFTGEQFNIIGPNSTTPFTGVFDGNGCTVHRFTYLSQSTEPAGLFSYVVGETAQIKDLYLRDVNVACNGTAGALAGIAKATVIGCGSDGGTVSGYYYVGGLIGDADGYGKIGEVSECFSTVKVVGKGYYPTGGLLGINLCDVKRCFSTGTVTGENAVGGLIGENFDCHDGANISDCYAVGDVRGHLHIGGLVGRSWVQPTISNCYSSGAVDGNELVGAFIGDNDDSEFVSCFWDTDVNPDVNGIGNGNDPNVIGPPTRQMQMRSTFADAGWDMVNVWDIGENQTYPFLRTNLPGDINKDDETNFYDLAIVAENWLKEE